MALEPLVATVNIDAGADIVSVTGAVLTPLNCRPGASVAINGYATFVKALLTTTTFQISRNWPLASVEDGTAEIAPFTAEMASRVALSQELQNYNANLVLFEAYRRGLYCLFSGETDLSDPEPGHIAFDNVDLSAATAMVISDIDANGQPQSERIAALKPDDEFTVRTVDTGSFVTVRLTEAAVRTNPEDAFQSISNLEIVETFGSMSADAYLTLELNRAGLAGRTWYSGEGAPLAGLGADGDHYFRDDTNQIYKKTVGAWSVISAVYDGVDGEDGVPVGYRLTFDASSTTKGNPGPGKVRANSLTFGSITKLWVNNVDADALDITGWLDGMDDVTNSFSRGSLTFQGEADPAVKMGFRITGLVTDETGYREVNVSPVAGANPADLTSLVASFAASGSDGSGTGDVVGPASATDKRLAMFAGTSGKLIAEASGLDATARAQARADIGLSVTGLFIKADPSTVAFTKTGAGTISIKAGTIVEVNGLIYTLASDTAVSMPSLTAGTDYAIWIEPNGDLIADTNFAAPATAGSRKLGGFHYAAGGNATAQAGGDTTAAINAYSIWDLKFRPVCPDPRGMTLVAGKFWCDIYLCGVNHHTDGTSKNNVTIADGSSPPKIPIAFGGNGSTAYSTFNWWEAAEVMASHGKTLVSYSDFAAAAYGVTENQSRGNDPITTGLSTTNSGSSNGDAEFTSKWGVMQAAGVLWVWADEFGGPDAGSAWANTNGGRGQVFQQSNAVLMGADWGSAVDAGSRASAWSNAPSNSNSSIGARGRCAHLCLE